MSRGMTLLVFVCSVGLWLPSFALAQRAGFPGQMDPAEMMKRFQDPAAMEKMAAEAQKAQTCLEDIDQKQIEALKRRAEAAGDEIKRLCAAGKKKAALAKGLSISREMRADTTIKKLRECTAGLSESMKGIVPVQVPDVANEPEPTDSDICS